MLPRNRLLAGAIAATAAVALVSACTGSGGYATPRSASASASASAEPSVAVAAGHLPLTCLPEGAQAAAIGPDATSTVVAWAGSGPNGVVLAPQLGQDACEWADEWGRLRAEGYAVASFGWSHDGQEDVRRTAAKLRELGVTRLAIVGASKGGTYAAAMAHDVGAVALVALSPLESIDDEHAASATSGYTGPIVVTASKLDSFAWQDSRLVARGDETFHLYDGDAHGVALLAGPHGDEVRHLIDATLAEGFGG